jgi:hypothetical protein
METGTERGGVRDLLHARLRHVPLLVALLRVVVLALPCAIALHPLLRDCIHLLVLAGALLLVSRLFITARRLLPSLDETERETGVTYPDLEKTEASIRDDPRGASDYTGGRSVGRIIEAEKNEYKSIGGMTEWRERRDDAREAEAFGRKVYSILLLDGLSPFASGWACDANTAVFGSAFS